MPSGEAGLAVGAGTCDRPAGARRERGFGARFTAGATRRAALCFFRAPTLGAAFFALGLAGGVALRLAAGAFAAAERAPDFFFAFFFALATTARFRPALACFLRTVLFAAVFLVGEGFFRWVAFLLAGAPAFERRVDAFADFFFGVDFRVGFADFAREVFRVFFLAGLMLGPSW